MKYLVIGALLVGFALPAAATTDLGAGVCVQADGQPGVWNGTSTDDDGCVTVDEYAAMFPEGLASVNSVGPDVEPDASTVQEWFDTTISLRFGPR